MNLHQIARGAIGAVNPFVQATVQISIGYGKDAAFKQIPLYSAPLPAVVQVQALEAGDLAQLDGINQQGIKRAIYLNGQWDGLVRPDGKGGDLVTMLGGVYTSRVWLVVKVLEYWPDWCKVAVVLQNETGA